MLHPAWAFRLTLAYEYMSRTKQMGRTGNRSRRGEETTGRPTSSSLRISDWPQVSRSCRAWDQKLSSWFRVPWQRGGLTNLWQRRNQNMRAALQSRGRCCVQKQHGKCSFWGCATESSFENLSGPQWRVNSVNSLTCGRSNTEESTRFDKAFKSVQFYKSNVTQKSRKLKTCDTKVQEKKRSQVWRDRYGWCVLGPFRCFLRKRLLWTRGDRVRCIYVKHQRARGQLVKQMRERIPKKEEKRTVWRNTKHESIQHKNDKKTIQTVHFAFVKGTQKGKYKQTNK